MAQAALANEGPAPRARSARRSVALSAYANREDGAIVHMDIVDLSYDGCGVVCTAGLMPGERVSLSVVRRGRAIAIVQWVDGAKAGLCFSGEVVEPPAVKKSRQHERVSVNGEARVCRDGRPEIRAHILDVSVEGCRIECEELLELGDEVSINFDGLQTLQATIVWIAATRVGLKFARSLHPVVFDLLTTRFR